MTNNPSGGCGLTKDLTSLNMLSIVSQMVPAKTTQNQIYSALAPAFAGISHAGFLFRCRICRCPILQDGDFDLCLGCAKDGTSEIEERLKRKKALVTRFERKYMLSEVLSSSKGGKCPESNPALPSAILEPLRVTKSTLSRKIGPFFTRRLSEIVSVSRQMIPTEVVL